MNLVINSDETLQRALGQIRAEYARARYLRLQVKTGRDRTLDQNAISHIWYEQLARELPQEDTGGWKAFCKLHFGVPILRAEDEDFRAFSEAALRPLDYEQRLKAMEYIPVTSLMTTKQLSKYLEAMQKHFRDQWAVPLEFPPEPVDERRRA